MRRKMKVQHCGMTTSAENEAGTFFAMFTVGKDRGQRELEESGNAK